jgi:uncharacterized membrane protein ArfC
MDHVHWPLFALSFAVGLVFTYALLPRPAKRAVPERKPPRRPAQRTPRTSEQQEVSATRIAGGRIASTTKIPIARKPPRRKPPVARKSPARKVPAAEKTTKIPIAEQTTKILVTEETSRIPVTEQTTKIPVTEQTTRIPVTEQTTKIPVDTTRKIKTVPYAPFGQGSARADADGNGPSDWPVKGRSDTRLYYLPGDPPYDDIKAQVWFRDEESAGRALFTAWRTSSQK